MVSASPGALWRRCTGRPGSRAKASSGSGGGRDAVALQQPQPSERQRVDDAAAQSHVAAAQRALQEAALEPGGVGDELRPRRASRSASSASSSGGPPAKSAVRRPWMRTVCPGGGSSGRTSLARIRSTSIRPPSTGTAHEAMISWRRGSSPVVSRSTTANGASRQGRPRGGRRAAAYARAAAP